MNDLISRQKDDLIRRSDAIEMAYQLRHKPADDEWGEWLQSFNGIPPVEMAADLISRRAAIDALAEELYYNEDDYRTAVKAIGGLPSAQPDIIRCKDCKYYEWMSNRVPEERAWYCHNWGAETGKDDFCSKAERRTDGSYQ